MVAAVDDKKIALVKEVPGAALIVPEPIHYHILPPNEPHPCDKYGCAREAKYQLGEGHYCHDKAVSHFTEVANKCQKEGFQLIEDVQMHDD